MRIFTSQTHTWVGVPETGKAKRFSSWQKAGRYAPQGGRDTIVYLGFGALRSDPIGRTLSNPILVTFREHSGGSDLFANAFEFLFQLARIWSEWQSPRIGTFPLDYRDPSGPIDEQSSLESGEDAVYWELSNMLVVLGNTDSNLVQDLIVHATAVLDRVLESHRHES